MIRAVAEAAYAALVNRRGAKKVDEHRVLFAAFLKCTLAYCFFSPNRGRGPCARAALRVTITRFYPGG